MTDHAALLRPGTPTAWVEPADLAEAADAQRAMAGRVLAHDPPTAPASLGGADISCPPRDPGAPAHAALVVLDPATLHVTTHATAVAVPRFPYVPGFLGFREIPVLLDALARLPRLPDLLLVDGHGVSHPRGLGIAAQLGVLLDRPTIGVAKSILVGAPAGPLGDAPGSRVDLVWRGRVIGAVLRSKPRCLPLYVSVGHRVSLDGAVRHVLRSCRGYRLPEPTRQAHLAANRVRCGAPGGQPTMV